MKRKNLILALLLVFLTTTSVYAQPRPRHDRGNHYGHTYKPKHHKKDKHHKQHDRYVRYGMERRCDRDGWYPGYRGRVRYKNGRWHYRRQGRWYDYPVFYEPDYYFRTPVATFSLRLR